MSKASSIVDEMMANDHFSQWLGIERLAESPGYCKLKMVIRKEMLNGFGVIHGGITFSLADSALAFAANGHGKHAVSIDSSISHTRPAQEGDELIAEATEMSLGRSTAVYHVRVVNQEAKVIAIFKATVYRKDTEWDLSENINS